MMYPPPDPSTLTPPHACAPLCLPAPSAPQSRSNASSRRGLSRSVSNATTLAHLGTGEAGQGAALGERLARFLGGVGNSARPAWKSNERPYTTDTRESLLTHDTDRYHDEIFWQQANPGNVTGPPSWKWVIEAFRSTRELRTNPALRRMDVPVLALIAEHDGLVDAKAALAQVGKLPDARIVRFGKESAHEILREADKVRNRAIGEIDLFLEARARRG